LESLQRVDLVHRCVWHFWWPRRDLKGPAVIAVVFRYKYRYKPG